MSPRRFRWLRAFTMATGALCFPSCAPVSAWGNPGDPRPSPRHPGRSCPKLDDTEPMGWRFDLLFRRDPTGLAEKSPKKMEVFIWLVVWLPFFIFPLILGMSSSQLTHIFQRGGSTTNQGGVHGFSSENPWESSRNDGIFPLPCLMTGGYRC